MIESSITTTKSFATKDIKEAVSIIDAETKRRAEEVSQRIEFMCASLRAQGNTEINKMLMSIRELTVEEFCEKYGADAQYFMSQQTIRRLGKPHMKRPTLIENEDSNTTQKKRSKIGGDMEKEKEKIPEPETRSDFGDIFVHLERKDQSKTSIQLDPTKDIKGLGNLIMDAPHSILKQLDDTQRSRVCEQIQDIQDQLESLKKSILS